MAETSDEVLEIPADDIAEAGGGELEYAGFWSRVAALIVDNAIVTIFGLALLIAAGFGGAGAVIIANLAYILVVILYWPLMESSERQATIGKQLLGIQVTDSDGARLTFVRALLRNLAKIISSIPFGLGFLFAAFTARKQALHDLITKCLVVRAGPSNFRKAVIAAVGALVISIGGGYYYFAEVYSPQMTQDMAQQMEKAQKEARKSAPAQAPVAQAPTPAPAPAAPPASEQAAPGAPKPMTPEESAEAGKKTEQAKREPEKAAAVTPPAPAKPAVAEIKPASAKPEPKPAAAAAAKPKPAPALVVEGAVLITEPPAPPPAPQAAQPKPAVPATVVVPPVSTRVRSPKFNDVMTAVMYRDGAAASELLELGWWADRPDSNGVTPLMAAAWNGDAAMTRLLLEGGADPNRRGPGGTVLDYASRGGDIQVIELLKKSGAR